MNEFKYTEPSIEEMAAPYRENISSPVDTFRSTVLWSNEQIDKALFNDPVTLIPNRELFHQAFGNNQIGDEQIRSIAKKAVVSEWYAKKFNLNRDVVKHGFDEITRQIFGKDISVDEVYNTIRDVRQKEINQNKTVLQKTGHALQAGAASFSKGAYDTARLIPDSVEALHAASNIAVFAPLEWLAENTNLPQVAEFARSQNWLNQSADNKTPFEHASNALKSASQITKQYAEQNMSVYGDGFGYKVIEQLPQVLFILATAKLQAGVQAAKAATSVGKVEQGISFGGTALGISSGASEWYDTENSGMSNSARLMNALAVGGAEMLFEEMSGAGRLFRKYWSKALPEKEIVKLSETFAANLGRTVKSIGIDAAVEGLEEVGTGITQRFSNLLFGKDGKTLKSMSLSDIAYELLYPVPMEFGVGGVTGGVMGGIGFKSRYGNKLTEVRNMNFNADRIVSARERLKNLQAIENPTQEQVAQMDFLEKNIAEHNYNALWNDEWQEYVKQFKQAEDDKLTDEEWKEKEFQEGSAKAKEIQSLENERTSEKTLEALDQSINNVAKVLKLGNTDIQLVKTVSDLPPHLQGSRYIDGVFDGSGDSPRIYLVAENLDAARVKKVILHEAVGHQGMRQIFGDSFNDFLRQIGSEHSAEIQSVAKRRSLDTSIEAKYLEAVEEFLAEKASLGVEDGTTWQKICAAFRQFLRNMGLNIAYSDNDIQQLFRQSLRAVQQQSPQTGNNAGESQMANIEQVNIKFNEDIDRQIAGNLPNGYIYQLGTPGNILLSTGTPNLPIELSASHLNKKANQENHPFNIEDIKNLPLMLQNPIGVFLYGDKEKAQNIIVEIEKDGKNFLVGLSLNYNRTGIDVNSIRGLFPKETFKWLYWIQEGKALYLNKEKVQNLIAQQRTNLADVSNLDLNSINNIIENFKNPSLETEKNQENIRKSISPVIEIEQFEGSDPLDNEYYQAMVNLRDQNLADTINARIFENAIESYPFTDEFPDWAEMSEDERIKHIHKYFDGMIEEEEEYLLSESQSEARSEQGHNEFSALNKAAEITRDYAEELGYDVSKININKNGTSFYITVDYEDSHAAWKLRISDHPQPPGGSYREREWGGGRDKADVEAVIQNDKIDLSPIWQFLEEHAPDNGVRFSISPQVDTPAFKNWFKDSKVVDENGNPLVVYHGSGTTFWEFKTEFTGLGNDQYGSGFYFTTNKETADIYTEKQLNGQTKIGGQDSPNVIQAYLSIQNPIVIDLNSDDMRPENLSRIEVTTKQAYEIIKRAPDIMDEENSPLGDFFEEYWENGPSDSMIRKAARYTDVWDLLSLQGDWFGGDNGATAFREAVHEVLGYDGVQVNFKNGEKHYVAWFPNQIKSATDNVGTFDPDNPDIRFSENQRIDDQKMNAWAQMLKKVVNPTFNDFQYIEEFMLKNGINYIPARDARTLNAALAVARDAVRERNKRFANINEQRFMRKKDKFYDILSSAYGENFTLNAGEKFDGQTFTGTWMDKHKTEKGRAASVKVADAAKLLSEKLGKEISPDMVVEHFAHLKKDALLAEYKAAKKDKRRLMELAAELEEEERMELTGDISLGSNEILETEEMKKNRQAYNKKRAKYRQEQYELWKSENLPRIYQWVIDYLQSGQKIKPSMRFAGEDFTGDLIPKAWKKYSRYNPGKNSGKKLADYKARRENSLKYSEGMNSDELAQALANLYGGDAVQIEDEIIDFFRDWKDQDSYNDYLNDRINQEKDIQDEADIAEAQTAAESYKLLLDQATQEKINMKKVLALVNQHIRKYVPKEMQGEFLSDIEKLASYSDSPSVQYPDGRRNYELEKLLRKIHSLNAKQRIMQLLDGTRVRVNSKGIPVSNFGENSEIINKIKEIVKLSPFEVESKLVQIADRIAKIENGEVEGNVAELNMERSLYDMFGRLDLRTPEQLQTALAELRKLIDQNKDSLYFRLKNILEENKLRNRTIMSEITGTENFKVKSQGFAESSMFGKFLLKNRNLKALLNMVTAKSGKAFEDTELGKLFAELEEATYKGAALDRQAMENVSDKLYSIFGLDNISKRRKFYEDVNEKRQSGVIVKRYQGEVLDYYDPKAEMEVTHFNDRRNFLKGKISVKSARKLLADYDAGNIKDADEIGIELLRQQLNDFDMGVERTYSLFGNQDQDEIWTVLKDTTGKKSQDELERSTKLMYIKPLDAELEAKTVTEAELELSKAEAATLLMAWEQKDVQVKMKWNGWSEKSIEQLKKFLGPQMIEYAYFLRDQIAATSKQLNDMAIEIYGVGLPGIENYFPTSYKSSQIRGIGKNNADGVVGDTYGNLSVNPNFLIARRFHLGEVDLDQSIFDVYMRHALETNHFLAFAKEIRKARSIFNNREVGSIIMSEYGKNLYAEIVDRIKVIGDGGRASGEAASLLGKLFRYWIPSKIALNVSSFAKQIAGSVSYINNIPFADYVNGVKDSFTDPLFAEFLDDVQNSDYFKNRQAGAMNRDLYYALKSTVNSTSTADMYGAALLDKSTALTRKGDAISVVRGGFAVFKYHYGRALSSGMDSKTAWETAMQKFRRATDETQQSGYLKDQNYFQSQSGMYRYLTAFLSNPTQIMNLQLETIDDIRYGKGARKEAAKQKLARQIFVNHILVPMLMTAITQFFRHGRDFDEYEWEDFIIASILGPFEGLFLGGKIAAAAVDSAYDIFTGEYRYQPSHFDALPILSDGINGMYRIGRLISADEITSANMYNAAQGLADLTMAAGSILPIPNAGATSAAASAILRELKRTLRLGKNLAGIEDDKKTNKKRKK